MSFFNAATSNPASANTTSSNTNQFGIFGGAAMNTNNNPTTTTTTNSVFGGSSTSPFNLPKPGDQTTAAPAKLAPSNFFSTPSTTSTSTGPSSLPSGFFGLPPKPNDAANTSTTAAPKVTSGLFGLAPKPDGTTASAATGDSSTSMANTSTPNTTSNIFGSGLFGKPASITSTTPAVTAPAFSLGGNKDTPAAPATSTPSIFSNLSGNKEGEKKDTPSPATFGLFGGAKPSGSTSVTKDGDKDAPSASTAAPSTAGPVVAIPPPSMLRGKTLEEIVNRWTAELETNVREFNKFAAEVAVWDRALIENGNNIAALHSHVISAERQQNDISESLDHIEQQQRDLASTLDTYEKVSQEILGGQGGSLRSLDTGPADNERDKNYMLATDLHTHLDDLSGSLTQMIESVNVLSISSNPTDSVDDPMTQIAQILSSHLESLQWIDAAVREVESKTTDVEKRVRESGHSLSNQGTKSRGFGLNR